VDEKRIQQIVFDALTTTNQVREEDSQVEISPSARLYGRDGQLESMELVALLIDIEEALQDEGYNISLSDERAMSQSKSPFRDIPSLVSYISTVMQESA
jgi:acyl carrier protein